MKDISGRVYKLSTTFDADMLFDAIININTALVCPL